MKPGILSSVSWVLKLVQLPKNQEQYFPLFGIYFTNMWNKFLMPKCSWRLFEILFTDIWKKIPYFRNLTNTLRCGPIRAQICSQSEYRFSSQQPIRAQIVWAAANKRAYPKSCFFWGERGERPQLQSTLS